MFGILSNISRKIRLVVDSDLEFVDKLRYVRDLGKPFLLGNARRGSREFRLRGGASVVLRGNTTDEKVFEEVFLEKSYAPYAKVAREIAPAILIDLGANIGLSVIALARKLQPDAIVAVEPDGDNFAALQKNLRLSALARRCVAVQAFAGSRSGFAKLVDSGNGAWGMRMGSAARTGIRVLTLPEIIDMAFARVPAGREKKVILKCDIEGAELHLFHHLLDWEDRVHYIILELHTEFLSAESFRDCLEASHYHWRMDGEIPSHAVLAVIGLERLDKKAVGRRERAAASYH